MTGSEVTSAAIPADMLAAVLDEGSSTMVFERIPVPVPQRDEALVRIVACGVCHSDLHVLKGELAFPRPSVLGHEVSGTVVAIGEGTTRAKVAPGDNVVGAFVMPCNACEACDRGRDDLCINFFEINRLKGQLYDGESRLHRKDGSELAMYSMGGLAEYAVIPLTEIAKVPDGIDLADAAILGCAVFTAFGAVRRGAELGLGEAVVVVGIGGVGSSIIQIARTVGAWPIIAVDISDEKLLLATELGAHFTVNARKVDAVQEVKAITSGAGSDVVFEALGTEHTFTQALAMLCEGGRLVAVGLAPAGTSAAVEITPLVRRSQRIIGSYGARTRTDLADVVQLVANGSFRLDQAISRRFPFAEANEAYKALGDGQITGRAIIQIGG